MVPLLRLETAVKTSLLRSCLLLLLAPLLALLVVGLPGRSARAPLGHLQAAWADEDDGDDGDDDGDGKDDEGLDDTADVEVPFAEQVNKAIDLGTRWLRACPKLATLGGVEIAHWGMIRGKELYGGGEGEGYGHPVGSTALALYTLLKCGLDPEDPIVVRGFNMLRETHPLTPEFDGNWTSGAGWPYSHREGRGSYELSAQILALTAKYDHYKRTKNTKLRRKHGKLVIKDKNDREWLEELVAALVDRRNVPNPGAPTDERRGWRYNLREIKLSHGRQNVTSPAQPVPPNANQDLSSTQLATLALFSAHQFSVTVPEDVWVDIVLFTLAQQEQDGPEHERHDPGFRPGGQKPPVDRARGFMYIKGSPDRVEGKATGSMTACGVANLVMAKDVLLESKKGKKAWEAQGFGGRVDQAILDGLAWLDLHWSAGSNPQSGNYHFYYLYGIERAMDLIDKQLVGKHVWYNEGATAILSRLQRAKAKDPADPRAPEEDVVFWNQRDTHDPQDVLSTCFALLFLKRAMKNVVPGVPITGGDGAPVDNR